MFHLRHIGPESPSARSICLTKTVTIVGRNSSQVDYVICSHNYKMNAIVSRRHCRLKTVNGCIQIIDDSRNGIFVNDVKIDGQAFITEGDVITFGHPNGEKLKAGIRARQPSSEYQYILERCFCKQTEPVAPPLIQTDCVVTACSVSSKQKPSPEAQDGITRVPPETNAPQTSAEVVAPELPADTKVMSLSSSVCGVEPGSEAANILESKRDAGSAACSIHHSSPSALHINGNQLEDDKHVEKVSHLSESFDEQTVEDFKQGSLLKEHLDDAVINRPALPPLHSDVSSGKNTSTGQEQKSAASVNLDLEPVANLEAPSQWSTEADGHVNALKDLNGLALAGQGHEERSAEVDSIQNQLIPVVTEQDLKVEKVEDLGKYVSQQDKPVLTKSQQDKHAETQAQKEKIREFKLKQDNKTGDELQESSTSETLPQQCKNVEDVNLKTGSEQNDGRGIVRQQDDNMETVSPQDKELVSQDHTSETEQHLNNNTGSEQPDNVTRTAAQQTDAAENVPQNDNSMKTESQPEKGMGLRLHQYKNVGTALETAENSHILLESVDGFKQQNAVNDGFVEKKDVAQFSEVFRSDDYMAEDPHVVSELKVSPKKATVLETIHSEPVSVAGRESMTRKTMAPITDTHCSQSNDDTNSSSFHSVSSSVPSSQSNEVLTGDSVCSKEGLLPREETSRGNDLSPTGSLLDSPSDNIHQSEKLTEEICAPPEPSGTCNEMQPELMQSQTKTDPSSEADASSPSQLDHDVNIVPGSSGSICTVGDEGGFGQHNFKKSDRTSEIHAESPDVSKMTDSEVTRNPNGTEDELDQSDLGKQSSMVVQSCGNFVETGNDLITSPSSFHLDTERFEKQICTTDKSKCLVRKDVKSACEVTEPLPEECLCAVGKDDSSNDGDVSDDRGNNPEEISSDIQQQGETPSEADEFCLHDSNIHRGSVSPVASIAEDSPIGLGSGSNKEVKDAVTTDAERVHSAEIAKPNLEKTVDTNVVPCCKTIDVQYSQSPRIQSPLSHDGLSGLASLQTPKQHTRQMKRPHTCEPPRKRMCRGLSTNHLSSLCLSPGLAHQRLIGMVPQVSYVQSILDGSLKLGDISEAEEHQFSDADGTDDELSNVEKGEGAEMHQSSQSAVSLQSENFDADRRILDQGQEKADPTSDDDKSLNLGLEVSQTCDTSKDSLDLELKDEDRSQEDQHIAKPSEQKACSDSKSLSSEEYVCQQCGRVMSVEDKENHWHANNGEAHSSDGEEDFIIIEEDEDDARAELPYVPSGKRRKLMFDEDQSGSKDELSNYWVDRLTSGPEQNTDVRFSNVSPVQPSIQSVTETNFSQSNDNKTVETPEINKEINVKDSLKESDSLKEDRLDVEMDTSQGNTSACDVAGTQTSNDLTESQSGNSQVSRVSLSRDTSNDKSTDGELPVSEKVESRTDREAVVNENHHVTGTEDDKHTCLLRHQERVSHGQTTSDHEDADQTSADELVSTCTNQVSDADSQTAQGQDDGEPDTQVSVTDMDLCVADVERSHFDTQTCMTDCDESVDDDDTGIPVTDKKSCSSDTQRCQSDRQAKHLRLADSLSDEEAMNLEQPDADLTVTEDVKVNNEVTDNEKKTGDVIRTRTDGDTEAVVGKMLPGTNVMDHCEEDLDHGGKAKVSVTKQYSRVQVKDIEEEGDLMATQTADSPDSIDLYLEPTQCSGVLSPNLEQCQSTQSRDSTEKMCEDELDLYVEATQEEGSDADINFSQMSDEVDGFKPRIQSIIHSLEEGSDPDELSECPSMDIREHELSVIQEEDENMLSTSSIDDSANSVPNSIDLSGRQTERSNSYHVLQELNKPAQTGDGGMHSSDASQEVDLELNSDTDSEVFSPLPCNQSWTSQKRQASADKRMDAMSADSGSELKENLKMVANSEQTTPKKAVTSGTML